MSTQPLLTPTSRYSPAAASAKRQVSLRREATARRRKRFPTCCPSAPRPDEEVAKRKRQSSAHYTSPALGDEHVFDETGEHNRIHPWASSCGRLARWRPSRAGRAIADARRRWARGARHDLPVRVVGAVGPMTPMSVSAESNQYVVPRWPDRAFNLVALEGGFELGPCTADSWVVADNGAITDWRDDGAHPIHLRVRMQVGDLLYANNGDIGDMTYRIVPVAEDGVTSASSTAFDLNDALGALWAFLDGGPLTTTIAHLEQDLDGSQGPELPAIYARYGIAAGALESSLVARDRLGRIK